MTPMPLIGRPLSRIEISRRPSAPRLRAGFLRRPTLQNGPGSTVTLVRSQSAKPPTVRAGGLAL